MYSTALIVVVTKEFARMTSRSCAKAIALPSLKIPAIFGTFCDKMADNDGHGTTLRQTLVECLTDILSPEQHVRSSAEERLKLLEVTEGKMLCVHNKLQIYRKVRNSMTNMYDH